MRSVTNVHLDISWYVTDMCVENIHSALAIIIDYITHRDGCLWGNTHDGICTFEMENSNNLHIIIYGMPCSMFSHRSNSEQQIRKDLNCQFVKINQNWRPISTTLNAHLIYRVKNVPFLLPYIQMWYMFDNLLYTFVEDSPQVRRMLPFSKVANVYLTKSQNVLNTHRNAYAMLYVSVYLCV